MLKFSFRKDILTYFRKLVKGLSLPGSHFTQISRAKANLKKIQYNISKKGENSPIKTQILRSHMIRV